MLAKTRLSTATRSLARHSSFLHQSFFDLSQQPSDFKREDISFAPDVISQPQHDALVDEILHRRDRQLVAMRKQPYLEGHWDSVIQQYRELERPMHRWTEDNQQTLEEIREWVQEEVKEFVPMPFAWLSPHIIDLGEDGVIDPHVDSIKFSGGFVAGLSLLSTRVMQLTKDHGEDETATDPSTEFVRLLLPPRSMYVLKGSTRYQYAHAIHHDTTWTDGSPVNAGRRLSIIMRDDLPPPWL